MRRYIKVCAWCQSYIQKPPKDRRGKKLSILAAEKKGFAVSHGICQACHDAMLEKTKQKSTQKNVVSSIFSRRNQSSVVSNTI